MLQYRLLAALNNGLCFTHTNDKQYTPHVYTLTHSNYTDVVDIILTQKPPRYFGGLILHLCCCCWWILLVLLIFCALSWGLVSRTRFPRIFRISSSIQCPDQYPPNIIKPQSSTIIRKEKSSTDSAHILDSP